MGVAMSVPSTIRSWTVSSTRAITALCTMSLTIVKASRTGTPLFSSVLIDTAKRDTAALRNRSPSTGILSFILSTK